MIISNIAAPIRGRQCRGSSNDYSFDVRFIAATNQNIDKKIEKGDFRSDLYYRLEEMPLTIPPLRERKKDIRPFVEHFLLKFSTMEDCKKPGIDEDAIKLLTKFDWPGNIRELETLIHILTVTANGKTIYPEQLKKSEGMIRETIPLKNAVWEVEKKCIVNALISTKGKKKPAAILLDISRATLATKIEKGEREGCSWPFI